MFIIIKKSYLITTLQYIRGSYRSPPYSCILNTCSTYLFISCSFMAIHTYTGTYVTTHGTAANLHARVYNTGDNRLAHMHWFQGHTLAADAGLYGSTRPGSGILAVHSWESITKLWPHCNSSSSMASEVTQLVCVCVCVCVCTCVLGTQHTGSIVKCKNSNNDNSKNSYISEFNSAAGEKSE